MEWISVNDHLPEMKEDDDSICSNDVLAFDGERMFVACRWKFKFREEIYFKSTVCDCCDSLGEITHWMPLPELPKESE